MENNSNSLKSLVEEDKYLIESFAYDNGETLRDGLVSRIYLQENGKFCLMISAKSKNLNYKEDVVYYADNLEDEKHARAMMVVSKNVYTRGHKLSYKLLIFYNDSWLIKFIFGIIIGFFILKIMNM